MALREHWYSRHYGLKLYQQYNYRLYQCHQPGKVISHGVFFKGPEVFGREVG